MKNESRSSRSLIHLGHSSIGILLALLVFVAFPSSSALATQCEPVYFEETGGTYIYVSMFSDTAGATIFFKTSPYAPPGNPTHTGGTAGPGTQVYNPMYPFVVVPWSNMYFRAVAYKAGFTDSVFTEYSVRRD
jgi:hypothetical protein